MKNNKQIAQKSGYYFGTEIDEKWWKRYSKNKMLARGKGQYWHDDEAFYFLRLLTRTPISIPLTEIIDFKLGKWHGGKWAGGQLILKIIWMDADQRLSSGFVVSKDKNAVEELISVLKTTSR